MVQRPPKLILNLGTRGTSSAFCPWLFIAAHGLPTLKELNALKFATVIKTMFFL